MSPKDDSLKVRLSTEDRERIEEAAKKAGFRSISEYIRYMTIGQGQTIDEKLDIIIKQTKK